MGPLQGVTIIELAGLGALPYGTLKLADMGADVIRVHPVHEVPSEKPGERHSEFDRGRRSIAIDLKSPDGVATLLRLVDRADALACRRPLAQLPGDHRRDRIDRQSRAASHPDAAGVR